MKSLTLLLLVLILTTSCIQTKEDASALDMAQVTNRVTAKGNYGIPHRVFYHIIENNDTVYSYPYLSDWKLQHPTDANVFIYKENGAKVFYPVKSEYYYHHTSAKKNTEYKKMELAVAPVQPIDSIVATYVNPFALEAGSRLIGSFAVPEIGANYHLEHDLMFNLSRPNKTTFETKIYEYSDSTGLRSAVLVVLEVHQFQNQSSWAISLHGMEAPAVSYDDTLQKFLKSHREIVLGTRAIHKMNQEYIISRERGDHYNAVYYTPKQEYERSTWLSREKGRTITYAYQTYEDYFEALKCRNWSEGDFRDDPTPIPIYDKKKHGYWSYSSSN